MKYSTGEIMEMAERIVEIKHRLIAIFKLLECKLEEAVESTERPEENVVLAYICIRAYNEINEGAYQPEDVDEYEQVISHLEERLKG